MIQLIDNDKFKAIVNEEIRERDALEPHTLDWYTRTNRISLLKKVEALFENVKVKEQHISPAKEKTEETKKEQVKKPVKKMSDRS